MRELEQLLPTLEPPPGGLARLQRSVASGRHRGRLPRRRVAWAAAACVLVAAALAVQVPARVAAHRQAHAISKALRMRLEPRPPAHGIVVARGAAIELPSGQGNVKLYLVQSIPPPGP